MGDEVELRVRIVRRGGFGIHTAQTVGYDFPGEEWRISERELDAGKLVPRPIAEGECVTWGEGEVGYTVAAIRDGFACLVDPFYIHAKDTCFGEAPPRVTPVSGLRRV